jgi:hypothetical protein
MTDAASGSAWHHHDVVITIRLDSFDPPAGRVSVSGQPDVTFVGWLGLLRVLSETVPGSVR